MGLKLLAMGADQMMISNNPEFRGAFWRPYSSKIPKWPLKMEEGRLGSRKPLPN